VRGVDHLPCTGVSHVELKVADLEASTAWYTSVVGLTFLRDQPGRYSILQPAAGGFRLALSAGRESDAHGEIGHVALAVESLEALTAWADRLTDAGVSHPGIKENNAGFSIDLHDPDGHEIELTYEH